MRKNNTNHIILSYTMYLIFVYLYIYSILQTKLIDPVYFVNAAKMLPIRLINYEFKDK